MTKAGLFLTAMVTAIAIAAEVDAQPAEANYDETKVPAYMLPDPLIKPDGKRVEDAEQWFKEQRPRILELFQTHVYGHAPAAAKEMSFVETSREPQALEGKAVRKEVTVYFTADKQGPRMDVLLYLPAKAKGPSPVFLGLNFGGNHTVHADPGITLARPIPPPKTAKTKPTPERSRGSAASNWQVEMLLSRGYGLATIFYGDIVPDRAEGLQSGVTSRFYAPGQTAARPDEWGAIGAWAWGLSRALDYLETDREVDAKRVAVIGHSRLGKTALWAGAQDTRFGIVISNNSGCGGAALSRRAFGETVARINKSFPHWFCDNFEKYNNNEAELPVDQHMLIALIAPRPVYVASASEDLWADPKGEFLSAKNADPVYRLLGTDGLGIADMPPHDQSVSTTVGYHIRTGKHDVTEFDWKCYLDFSDKHFGKPSRE